MTARRARQTRRECVVCVHANRQSRFFLTVLLPPPHKASSFASKTFCILIACDFITLKADDITASSYLLFITLPSPALHNALSFASTNSLFTRSQTRRAIRLTPPPSSSLALPFRAPQKASSIAFEISLLPRFHLRRSISLTLQPRTLICRACYLEGSIQTHKSAFNCPRILMRKTF